MGGDGSGGARLGSGRKPKSAHQRYLDGGADKRGTGRPRKPAPLEPVTMPADLPEAQRVVWLELAPHAITARTLAVQTVAAFRDLCMAIVARDAMQAQIAQDGLTYLKVSVDGAGVEHSEIKAHPLISQHRGMMQRVEAGMVRFRLCPVGKELSGAEQPVNPFDEFEGSVQ
jgi:hypothetical protein